MCNRACCGIKSRPNQTEPAGARETGPARDGGPSRLPRSGRRGRRLGSLRKQFYDPGFFSLTPWLSGTRRHTTVPLAPCRAARTRRHAMMLQRQMLAGPPAAAGPPFQQPAPSSEHQGGGGSRRASIASALHEAAAAGDAARTRALLAAGADANSDADDIAGEFPLHIAAERGAKTVVAVLLEQGEAYTDVEDIDGATPMHAAARCAGNADLLTLLLRAGGEPSATDRRGSTPIHIAAGAGHPQNVRALLAGPEGGAGGGERRRRGRGGVDTGAAAGLSAARQQNREGLTALQLATRVGGDSGLAARALLEAAECRGQLGEAVRRAAAEIADRVGWERRARAAEAELQQLRAELAAVRTALL